MGRRGPYREELRMSVRFLLRPNALAYVRLVPAVVAGVLLAVTSATTQLPALARGIAIAFLVGSVIVSLLPKRNDVKTHGSVTLAIIAVAVSGQTRTGVEYAIGATLFAIVVLACLRAPLATARMRGAESVNATVTPRTSALVVLVVIAASISTALVIALPRLSAIVERQVQRLAGDVASDDDQVGFSTNVRVGSLRHMLQSDRVVMRASGERVDYLRGGVLDRYESRMWSSTQAATTKTVPARAPEDEATTHVELSRAALTGRVVEPRWFLPEDACDVHTPSGRIGIDPHGATHPEPPNDAREISFRRKRTSTCSAPLPEAALPNVHDLGVADKIRGELAAIAVEWTRGTTTRVEALEAIVHELSAYPYSLQDRREGRVDPVLEFLERRHPGHCELFASAMALLARTIGIPTRLAVGYRVDEVNPITGLSVIRDRNAHTWVEAWVGDHWQTFDPTPIAELHATTRPSRLEDLGEALSFAWDRTIGFFANVGLARTGIFSAVLAVVLLVVRRFTQRRGKAAHGLAAASRPLPAFETLATALARAGWERVPSEPLERFARRVDAAGEPWSSEVAEALTRYAELRYGGIGEEKTVAQRLDELARKVLPTS